MDLEKMIFELRAEKSRLDAAIEQLHLLATGRKRRGRPPKGLAQNREGAKAAGEPDAEEEK